MRHITSLTPANRILAAIFSILLIFTFISVSRAEPAPDTQPSNEGWVDLQASVPDGFSGTVSALLSHAETGETLSITAHYAGSFKNSAKLPCGEYFVERVYTSEDSFIYEAFTETDTITVNEDAAQVIKVTVKYNEAAAEFLESPDSAVPPAPEQSEPSEPIVKEPEAQPELPVQSEPKPAPTPEPVPPTEETDPSEDPSEVIEPFSFRTILSKIASCLFSALIFSGAVFIGCWLYRRYQENNN